MPVTMTDKLLTVRDLCRLFGVRKLAIYEMVKKGRLPKPMQPGGRKMLWFPAEVERFLLASRTGTK
jgi:excisionase family DNA binding protein